MVAVVEDVHDPVALKADDFAVEAIEEDGVPRFVLDLRADEDLVFFAAGHHERYEVDLDLTLAVVEAGRDVDERLAFLLGHLLVPVDCVL